MINGLECIDEQTNRSFFDCQIQSMLLIIEKLRYLAYILFGVQVLLQPKPMQKLSVCVNCDVPSQSGKG